MCNIFECSGITHGTPMSIRHLLKMECDKKRYVSVIGVVNKFRVDKRMIGCEKCNIASFKLHDIKDNSKYVDVSFVKPPCELKLKKKDIVVCQIAIYNGQTLSYSKFTTIDKCDICEDFEFDSTEYNQLKEYKCLKTFKEIVDYPADLRFKVNGLVENCELVTNLNMIRF